MNETKQQVTARKIRNGLRKQASKILREKEKVWDILKRTDNDILIGTWPGELFTWQPVKSFYCPYVPITTVSCGLGKTVYYNLSTKEKQHE